MDPQTTMQSDFLEHLCRANEGQLEAYLAQIVGSADVARELVKDSFARVRMSRPEQTAFPRAALFRVATNVALLHLRKRRAVRTALEPAMDCEEEARMARSDRFRQSRHLSADAYGASLVIAIKALHQSHRKVFVMAHVQGRPRCEIAGVLGISEARVDERITKALKAVRDHLGSRGIDPTDILRSRRSCSCRAARKSSATLMHCCAS